MEEQVCDTQEFTTLEELGWAIDYWRNYCKALGFHESTVYVENGGRMSLMEETLTDGSKVLNLRILTPADNTVATA